jgi:hypothetical protein
MEQKDQRAIDAIDNVTSIALKWMNGSPSFIRIEFMKVFAGKSPELISHYIDKWDGDFARFYLNMDETMRRSFFNFYSIALEDDKYFDDDLDMALINGKNKFDVFPFESYIAHLFYLTAYNNSLELFQDISPDAFLRIENNDIDLYGNGLNWSQAWQILTDKEKTILTTYIIEKAE